MMHLQFCNIILAFWLTSWRLTNASSPPPNILFLVIDDLRPALGCYDYPKVLSPNINQLASMSVQFNNAHVQQTVCAPSRTSFLTSRRPDTTRLYDFGSYWRNHAGNYTTLPQHFKEYGYFTYSIGKVFHPGIPSNYNDDYPYSWSKPAYHPSTEKYKQSKVCPGKDGKLHKNLLCPVDILTQPEKTLPDIQSAEQAVKMLKEFQSNKSQNPFFLAVGFHKPHIPYKFPEDYLALYPYDDIDVAPNPFIPRGLPNVAYSPFNQMRKRDDVAALNLSYPFAHVPDYFHRKIRQHYYCSVTYTDAHVGQVLGQLDQSGFSDNTIIVLIGDHGWSLGEHGEFCKYENLEVVTRVPLLVHVPGLTDRSQSSVAGPMKKQRKFTFLNVFDRKQLSTAPRGPRSNSLVEAVDVFPTLSDLAGLKVPPTCPPNPFKVELCTEGASFRKVIEHSVERFAQRKLHFLHGDDADDEDLEWKDAVFSQYPRPSDYPQPNTDLPSLKDIKIMGYTMRSKHHRYTEWVSFDPDTYYADFNKVHARELYLRDSDPLEVYNVADLSVYQDLVEHLRKRLIAGWRHALPE